MKTHCRKTRKNAGFTLIELLVVLVILGLLASVVGPRVLKNVGDSKTKTARLQIEELSAALDLYRLEVGTYPSTEQGLKALIVAPAGMKSKAKNVTHNKWNGPYLRKAVIRNDPWDDEYIYQYPGKHGEFDLFTLGSDHTEGGTGEGQDVLGWE